MSEFIDNLKAVPDQIVLAGDGLRTMELEQFKLFVRQLGRLGIEIVEAPDNAEIAGQDIPIRKGDFRKCAEFHGIDNKIYTRTWHNLIAPQEKYEHAAQRQAEGKNLMHWELRALKTPNWQLELSMASWAVSYVGLASAYKKEKLEEVRGIGPKSLQFISHLLSDIALEHMDHLPDITT